MTLGTRSLGLDSKVKLEGLGGRRSLRNICMAVVMTELDSCLSLDPEALGRHSDRDGRVECTLCGAECKSVVHVLWECSIVIALVGIIFRKHSNNC